MDDHIQRILAAARRSPSGDNCQPFRFQIENSETIHIYHLEESAKHFFNYGNHASLIALGTTVESMKIEAQGKNYYATVALTKNLGSAHASHWATIKLSKSTDPIAESLVGAFDKRWTNRFPYLKDLIPDAVVQECKRQARRASADVELSYAKPLFKDFIDYFKASELFLWKHKEAAKDLLKMLRFNTTNKYGDGIAIHELGVQPHEKLLMRLLQKFPNLVPVLYSIGLKIAAQMVAKKNYLSSGGLFTFSVRTDLNSTNAYVEVGRAALRVWMHLNQQGYVVQPVSSASMLCYQNNNRTINPNIFPEYVNIYNQGSKLWRKYFKIPEDSEVVWALRVGLPLPGSQPIRSRRLQIEDLVKE